jgi:phospholipid/cholesterol/gamma-HCH transport system permease protein
VGAITIWLEGLGDYAIFVFSSMQWAFRKPSRWKRFIEELEFVGNESLFIVGLSAFFTGAVFAYQSWIAFRIVGATSLVGSSVAISLARELAPVMTGLVVTGRAGAAMAAQIGLMRVTEQIDALEVMAVNPKQYLIAPRILAGAVALPLLTALFCLVGNLGGYVVGTQVCGVDPGIYITKLKNYLLPWDFYHGLIKSVIYGVILSSIGCYMGYKAERGAEGVGKATNSAVVFSIVTILVLDYFLSIYIPSGDKGR